MAQWCNNRVIFYADKETRRILERLFKGIAENEMKRNDGQLPPLITEGEHGFRNIRWSDEEEVVYYDTKHLPNLDELVALATFYRCPFECTYRLPAKTEYARVLYKDGILKDVSEIEPLEDSREITVIDLEGKEKKVTDLDSAIALTAEFMGYYHEDERFAEFDNRMREYWTDLNAKLNTIKKNRNII